MLVQLIGSDRMECLRTVDEPCQGIPDAGRRTGNKDHLSTQSPQLILTECIFRHSRPVVFVV